MKLEEGKIYKRKRTKQYPLIVIKFIRYEEGVRGIMVRGILLYWKGENKAGDSWYKEMYALKFHDGEWEEITESELSAYLL